MSCCSCLKIQILTPVDNMPSGMLEGGKLYLDLDAPDVIELSRSLSELSEIENIKDEAALSFSIPYSDKNLRIADFVRNHNLTGNKYGPLAVLVQEGPSVHRFNFLQFTGSNDQTRAFDAQLERGEGHWLHDANRLYIRDIPFEDFELTEGNLSDNWFEQDKYDGQDSVGYYWPLVNYGKFLREQTILPEDFRPWFHLLAILDKGFCEIGWKFRSPFFETNFGRRLICYLLSENLLDVPEILALRRFRATAQAYQVNVDPGGRGNRVIFGTEEIDPGNAYNATLGHYSSVGVFTFRVGIEYEFPPSYPPGPAQVVLEKEAADGTLEELAIWGLSINDSATSGTVTLVAENVVLAPGDRVSVRAIAFSPMICTGYFEGDALKAYLETGMVFNPALLIDPELTLLDIMKGAVHLCNGRIDTNWQEGEVWVYQPYETDVFDETDVEGFFRESPVVDVSEIVLPDSELVTVERVNKKRFLVLQFADTGDEEVKNMNEGATEQIYSKIIDRGSTYEEGKEYSKNPVFEPTVNKLLVKFPQIVPLIVPNDEVDIPHISDNDNGDLSFKIGPRILYCAGMVRQETEIGYVRRWRFLDSNYDQVPYAFQVPGTNLDAGFGNPGYLPAPRVIYGGQEDSDFYSMCYERDLVGKLSIVKSSFQALVTSQDYKNLSFRDLYKLHYGGRTFLSRLQEISGHRTCSGSPAEIILRPEVWGGDICEDKPKVTYKPEVCPNYPEIEIQINVSENTVAAVAQNAAITDPVLSDVWEYSTDGGSTWLPYTEGAPLSGYLEVVFRRTVSFDAAAGECEKVATRTAVFETACDNKPEITLNYDSGKNVITAVGAGEFNSEIDTDTWTVEVDGAAAVPYTEGDAVGGFLTVRFVRVVSFTNSCKDVTAEKGFEVDGDQCNNQPGLDLVEVSDCVYDPAVSGTYSSAICSTYIEVSNDGGSRWFAWDGYPIKGEPGKKVRATFHFCDSCPPVYIEKDCPF